MPNDRLLFFRQFLANPNLTGSVAPSSPALCHRMFESADLQPGQVVVELGAGTGPITKVLAERLPDTPILALEPNPELAARLREVCPAIEVVEAFAQELPRLVEEWGHPEVDRVVSGLPWTLWPDEVQIGALDAVVEVLKPDGRFVTYNYLGAHLMPKAQKLRRKLSDRFGSVQTSKTAWANVPPAFVYICTEPKKG